MLTYFPTYIVSNTHNSLTDKYIDKTIKLLKAVLL